jgi:hypothetical protein
MMATTQNIKIPLAQPLLVLRCLVGLQSRHGVAMSLMGLL